MSNWTIIVESDLLSYADSRIIATANSIYLSDGSQMGAPTGTPVASSIADAVANVRAHCSTSGAQIDANPAKVPNCLKPLAVRAAVRALQNRINCPLTESMKDDRRDDEMLLLRVANGRQRFETPDNPAGTAEQQPSEGDMDLVSGGFGCRDEFRGLL